MLLVMAARVAVPEAESDYIIFKDFNYGHGAEVVFWEYSSYLMNVS